MQTKGLNTTIARSIYKHCLPRKLKKLEFTINGANSKINPSCKQPNKVNLATLLLLDNDKLSDLLFKASTLLFTYITPYLSSVPTFPFITANDFKVLISLLFAKTTCGFCQGLKALRFLLLHKKNMWELNCGNLIRFVSESQNHRIEESLFSKKNQKKKLCSTKHWRAISIVQTPPFARTLLLSSRSK